MVEVCWGCVAVSGPQACELVLVFFTMMMMMPRHGVRSRWPEHEELQIAVWWHMANTKLKQWTLRAVSASDGPAQWSWRGGSSLIRLRLLDNS